jgi:hypothetical protein
MKLIVPYPGEGLMDLWTRCNGVYICPKVNSVCKGPLVPYAGKDSQDRNLVGYIYANFRKVEPHLKAVGAFAEAAYNKLCEQGLLDTFDTICGIPQGGRTFGQELARIAEKRFVYPDKKPKPTEAGKKQEYTWDLSQFEFESGERVAIAEDVFNNLQNTDNTLTEVAVTGADVVLLVGAFNRSPIYDAVYVPKSGPFAGRTLPIVASIREAYSEYEQDDPVVKADIAACGLELEVKKNWARLRAAMENFSH